MKTQTTPEQLKEILRLHALLVKSETGGERANLSGADLRSANLYGANLSGADLRSADLRSANLSGANLYGANLRSANLYGADLRSANLYGANLYGADLRSANLYDADLRSANLSESRGVQYAQAAFTGHGERGRMLTLAAIDSAKRFFCGCFQGTPEELAEYIAKGPDDLKKSRTLAMNFCLEAFDTVNI